MDSRLLALDDLLIRASRRTFVDVHELYSVKYQVNPYFVCPAFRTLVGDPEHYQTTSAEAVNFLLDLRRSVTPHVAD